MVRTIVVVAVIAMAFLLPRCSSMDTEAVKSMDRVGVSLMGANKYIDMGEFTGIGTIIQRLADNENFRLHPIVDEMHKKTFTKYNSMMPFELIDEEKVIGTKSYKNFQLFDSERKEENFKKGSRVITPDGYKKYYPKYFKNKHTSKLLDAMPSSADGMMYIYVGYSLKKHNVPMVPYSNGSIKAKVHIELYDKEGQKVMNVIKKGESDEKINIVAGTMPNPDKIQPMCKNATDKAFKEVKAFIQGELSS